MSTTTPARKPAVPASTTPAAGLRKPVTSQTTPNRSTSPAKPGISPQVLSSNGVARSPSTRASAGTPRPVRPSAVRRTGSIAAASGQTAAEQAKEEDAKAENVVLIDGLKDSLRTAETLSDDYQKQLAQTQQRVDELLTEHTRIEERLQESLERNEELENSQKDATRQLREAGNIYESEKAAMMKDREDSAIREEELRTTIKTLKDKISGRDAKLVDERDISRTGRPLSREDPATLAEAEAQFAPSSSLRKPSPQRSDSKSTSRLVMQKDQVIESLRLELAEAQIKLMEAENAGGGRMAELEKTLMETRMTNARLMEDNESYQLLLGEKTMNGELARSEVLQNTPTTATLTLGSLAEEMETAESNDQKVQQLTIRVKSLEDEKKALTLYIEKMLVKIMENSEQQAVLGKDEPAPPQPAAQEAQPTGFLGGISRSLSVISKRQRPLSQLTVSSAAPSDDAQGRSRPSSGIIAPAPQSARSPPQHLTNDPHLAPSIPLGRSASVQVRSRGHRRSQSSQSALSIGAHDAHSAQSITMPPPMQRQISGSRSPGEQHGSGPGTPRNSFFTPSLSTRAASSASNTPATGSIAEEGSNPSASRHVSSSGASFTSNENLDIAGREGAGSASPPRNTAGQTNYTGAVMTQNKLRPLRLVQQGQEVKDAEEAARKKANRQSWMGWLKGGVGDQPAQQQQQQQQPHQPRVMSMQLNPEELRENFNNFAEAQSNRRSQ